MVVRVDVLGSVRVLVDAEEVNLGRPVHHKIVARLAAAYPAYVSSAALIDDVWDERGTSLGNLHAVMSRLRGQLGPDGASVIATRHGSYGLHVAPLDIDALCFAAELKQARAEHDPGTARSLLEAALARWRGEPYGGLSLPFAEHETIRLHELRLAGIEQLARLEIDTGDPTSGVERLVPVVLAHPLRESLREALMLGLHRLGRDADALSAFEEGRQLLADQLGVDPSAALRSLHSRILRQELPPPVSPSIGLQSVRDTPRVIGRSAELQQLARSMAGPAGPVTVVFVEGEAGIGKSHLVEAALAALPPTTVSAVGSCWDHAGPPPLWPWEQILTALSQQLPRAEAPDHGREDSVLAALEALQRPVEAGAPVAEVAGTRAAFFRAVTALLGRMATTGPVVIVLEDGQWADDESVALAEHLVASLRDVRLTFVITLRDPVGPGHHDRDATADLVAALSRHRLTEHLQLSGLSIEGVRELAEQHTGSSLDDDAALRLLERTEGNPFFIEELARLFAEEVHRSGHARSPVPSSVRAVIERRLRHLPPDDRSVMLHAALAGRVLDFSLLRATSGLAEGDLLDSIDRALRTGLITADRSTGQLRFSHLLVQEALSDSVSGPRAAVMHRAIADELRRRPDADPSRVAHHLRQVGGRDLTLLTAEWMLRAARQAERRMSLGESVRLTEEALELMTGSGIGASVELELDARLRLAALLTQQLGYSAPRVARTWRETLELAQKLESVEHLMAAMWGVWHNEITTAYAGDYAASYAACDMIERSAPDSDEPRLAALLHLARGQTSWHAGQLTRAEDELRQAVDLLDTFDDDEMLRVFPQHPGVQARSWLAVTVAMRHGSSSTSDAIADELRRQCEEIDHAFSTTYADIVLALRAMWLGRADEAGDHAGAALRTAAQHDLLQLQAYAALPAGWADVMRGESATGALHLQSVISISRAIDGNTPFGTWLILALLAIAQAASGDIGTARTTLAEAERVGLERGITQHPLTLSHVAEGMPRFPRDPELTRESAWSVARAMLTASGQN